LIASTTLNVCISVLSQFLTEKKITSAGSPVTFYENGGQKKGSTFLKSRAKVVIVGLFSYVYINKSGLKNPHIQVAALAKTGILTRFIAVNIFLKEI